MTGDGDEAPQATAAPFLYYALEVTRRTVTITALAAALLWAAPSAAQLDEMRIEDLRLLYVDATQGYLAPYVARTFFNSLEFQEQLWDWEPTQPITVILVDLSDRGNAAAGAVPRNLLLLEIAPLSFVYEIVSANERMNWLMNHELVHIVAADQASSGDRAWRKFFRGKVQPIPEQPGTILYAYLTAPRDAAPRWYHEGIAVFVETWMAGGMGRAQGAWDEMVFRSMVRDDSHFYDPLGLVSEGTKIDFQVEVNSYLYGTRFMSYLAYQYGPDRLVEWVARHDGSKRYYETQFKHVYGMTLDEAWADWVSWEHEFQETNLAAIRQYPTTPYNDLSGRALGSVSQAFFDADRGQIYAAFNYPGVVSHLGSISVETGEVEKIIDVKDPVIFTVTSVAYDSESNKIFYTTDNLEYRDLRVVDPETGKSEILLKDARIGDLAFNPADRSIWGVRHFNGFATLVRIPYPYSEWKQVHTWDYGNVIYDLDISSDGTMLSASIGEVNGHHSLKVMPTDRLLAGDTTAIEEVEFGTAIPSNFVFSPDGRYLFGSTFYTGVSNIFRYELATDEVEAVTNTETGFFRPIPLDDGSLIVFRYTGEGFVPCTITPEPLEDVAAITFLGRKVVEKYPVVKDWMVGSPADVALEEKTIEKGPYHGFRSIGIESIYPIIEGYKDYGAVGFRLNLSDPMLLNRVHLSASYTPSSSLPSDERLHLELGLERYNWDVTLRLNNADFYDLFGPTKQGLKGYSAEVGWDRNLLYDKPRRMDLELDGAAYGGLDQVPGYQNVASPYSKLFQARAKLHYENVRSSLGHVDDEKGVTWEVVAASNYVNEELIPLARAGFDIGFALPMGHSSIWLRSDIGYASGDVDDPFANFYFGGFGNNYVDEGEIKRYREWYSFPGVDLNSIGGQTFAKALLEWNLPPLRFEKLGWTSFYVTWARASIFTTGLVTSPDDSDLRSEYGNIGAQIDVRFTALSRLQMTISLGLARAFLPGGDTADEVMLSLKIL
jgi:hypothetical protein